MTSKMEKELMLISWWSKQEKSGRETYVTMMPHSYAQNLLQTQRVLMTASAMGCNLSVTENFNFISKHSNEKFHFSIFEISGSDRKSLGTCNRLISKYFPLYSVRLECENGPFFMDSSAKGACKASKVSLYKELKAAHSTTNPVVANENYDLKLIAKDILSSVESSPLSNFEKKDAQIQCSIKEKYNDSFHKKTYLAMRLLKRNMIHALKSSRNKAKNPRTNADNNNNKEWLSTKCLKTIYKMYILQSLPISKVSQSYLLSNISRKSPITVIKHVIHPPNLITSKQLSKSVMTQMTPSDISLQRSFSDPYMTEIHQKLFINKKSNSNLKLISNSNDQPLPNGGLFDAIKPKDLTETKSTVYSIMPLTKLMPTQKTNNQLIKGNDSSQPIPKPRGESKETIPDTRVSTKDEENKTETDMKPARSEFAIRRKIVQIPTNFGDAIDVSQMIQESRVDSFSNIWSKVSSDLNPPSKMVMSQATGDHKQPVGEENSAKQYVTKVQDATESRKDILICKAPKPKPRITTLK